MPKKIFSYLNSFVLPTDYLFNRPKNEKPNVGWCSVFPPTQNGAAAVTYYHFKETQKDKRFNLFAIPLNGRIDKSLFPSLKIARLEDGFLDAVIFFCLGLEFEKNALKTKAKKIAWQTVHFLPSESKSEAELFRQLKLADKVFLTGKWAIEYYRKHGIKAEYLPIGVDTKIFKPAPKKNQNKIIFVNRLHERKGIIELLDAIPEIIAKDKKIFLEFNAPLDKFSEKKQIILKKISKLKQNFPENTRFSTEWKDFRELPNVYSDAAVLVFPSNNEGFGVPLIEASSSGAPSIVVDKPPMNEIIRNGKDGITIKLKKDKEFPTPEQLRKSILSAKRMQNCVFAKRLRQNAIKRFEIKKIIKRLTKSTMVQ